MFTRISLSRSAKMNKVALQMNASKAIHTSLSTILSRITYSSSNQIQKRNFIYTTHYSSNNSSVISYASSLCHKSSFSSDSSYGKKIIVPLETPVLKAMGRALDSRQLKSLNRYTKEDWVPGVIYGKDEHGGVFKRMICVSRSAFLKLARKRGHAVENTIFEVVVSDKTFTKADKEAFKVSYVDKLAASKLAALVDGTSASTATAGVSATVNTATVSASSANASSDVDTTTDTAVTPSSSSRSSVATGGEIKYRVVPRQIDYHPLTDEPISINFLRYWPGENRLRIPIQYINEDDCADFKKGGHLVEVNRFVECICDKEVPQYLIVDMTDKKIGDVIKLKDMKFPRGVRPSKSVNAVEFVAGVMKCVVK